jgi:hypothetical protein
MNNNIINKEVNYLGRDFGEFRNNLIKFAQTYFPNTYTDFNETDPGMLFIESAAYVGDVLSFYTDIALRENLLVYAQDRENILDMASHLGYKPQNVISAITELDVYQIVPSVGIGSNVKPDFNYALTLEANSTVSSKNNLNIVFRTIDEVNFKYSSSFSPTDISVYEVDLLTNEPTYYLLKKRVKAISGNVLSSTFTFTNARPYDKLTITDSNISSIVDVYDSNGDKWYEVPSLATDTIFESVLNIPKNDPELFSYSESVPYLLKLKQVPKRFIRRVKANGNIVLQFGSGISSKNDEDLIPNPDLIGNSLSGFENYNTDYSIDPSNFLYTKTYGLAPSDTILTVRYTVGNGIIDNVGSNELTEPQNIRTRIDRQGLDNNLLNLVIRSVAFNNPIPATGAKGFESINDIKLNAMANFSTQNRIVTKEDYIVRTYTMPAKYGSVAKAFIMQDDQLNTETMDYKKYISNPLALNLYILSYDANKKLVLSNRALKENLQTYLGNYRMLTDAINIKDAFVINLGIEFEVYSRPEYNSNEVLLRCINKLKEIFNIDNWQINQTIYISNIYTELDKIEGVQTVSKVNIFNKFDSDYGYSGNVYDIKEATRNGVIYPSLDPSIFEVRFPNRDIVGRVLNGN